jgi:putative peptidoglycan lipid II flippase
MTLPDVRQLPIAAALSRRLSGLHVNHKRIAASALLIGILTIVAKLFVAGREIAIAWRYGVSGTVDAYQLAITIVTWLPMMLISVMSAVLVPRLVALQGQSPERRRFIDELNGIILLSGLVLALIIWAGAPLASRLLGSGLQARTVQLTTDMCRIMSPVGLFFLWSGYLSARLQARERFAYTVTEAAPALIIAVAVVAPVLWQPAARLGWATSAGYAVQLLALLWMVRASDRPIGRFGFGRSAPEWGGLYGALGLMALAQIVLSMSMPIDQAFAARIGAGAVATFGYATRLITLITGLSMVVIGRALLPVLSRAVAAGDEALARRHASQWSAIMLLIGVFASFVLWLAAPKLVEMVFERGAFTAADTRRVTAAFQFGLVQLPIFFAGIIATQWYAAVGRFRDMLLINAVAIMVKIALNALLTPRLAVPGIMLSTAAMYLTTTLLMILFMFKGISSSAHVGRTG